MAIFTKHQNFKPVATYTMMAALLWATVLTVYAQELTPLLREKIKLEHRSSSVIPSPVTIQNHQAVTQGRFLIETSQASTPIIPETKNQRVIRHQGNQLLLETSIAEPLNKNIQHPFNQGVIYQQSSALHPATASSITALVNTITGKETNLYRIAGQLQWWVAQNIETVTDKQSVNTNAPSVLSLQTPEQTLASTQGSAIDKALLLTTLFKAAGIPAQLGFGVHYQPLGQTGAGSFQPSVWTQAYLGEWLSYSANNKEQSFDGTHLLSRQASPQNLTELNSLWQDTLNTWSTLSITPLTTTQPGSQVVSLNKIQSQLTELPKIDLNAIDIKQLSQNAVTKTSINPKTDPLNFLKPPTKETYLTLGLEALTKGDAEQAQQWFKQSVKLSTKHPLTHYYEGQALVKIGAYSSACNHFATAIQKDPALTQNINDYLDRYLANSNHCNLIPSKAGENQFLMAIHNQQWSTTKKIDQLKILNQQAPDFTEALYHLGELSLKNNQPVEAAYWFNKLKNKAPTDPRSYKALSALYAEQNNWTEAREIINQAPFEQLAAYPAVTDELITLKHLITGKALLAKNKNNPEGWEQLAEGLKRQGKLDDAMSAANRIMVKTPHRSADAKMIRMELHQLKNQWDAANKLAPLVYPNIHRVPQHRALAYRILAHQAQYKNQSKQAQRYFQHSIAAYNNNPDAYLGLANLYSEKQQWQSTQQVLAEGLQTVQSLQDKIRLTVQLGLAQEQTDPTAATKTYQTIIDQQPQHFSALQQLGELALRQNKLPAAEAHLKGAYAINPLDSKTLASLGKVYETKQDLENSLAFYQSAINANPDHQEARLRLAALIEANELPIKKPDLKPLLEEKSEHYLRSALSLEQEFMASNKKWTEITKQMDLNNTEKNVKNIINRRKITYLYKAQQQSLNRILNKLNALKPTLSTSHFHNRLRELMVIRFYGLEIVKRVYTGFSTETRYKIISDKVNENNSQIYIAIKNYKSAIKSLKQRIPQNQLNSLFIDAGFKEGLTEYEKLINQSEESIAQTISAKNNKPNSSEKKAPQKARAVSNLDDLSDDERKKLNNYLQGKN